MGYLDNNGVAYLYSKIKEYIAVQKPYSIAVGNGEPYSVWKGTYTEYCAITPDESTIYIITTPPYDAEIEYLESTGTQYIDSGLECTGDLSVECMVRVAELGGKIAGGIKAIDGKYYRHHMIILPTRTDSTGPIQIYWYQYNASNNSSVIITSYVTYSDYTNTWLPFSLNAITGAWTFASYSGSVTPLSASLTTGENYAIFGRIGLGTVATAPCAFKYFKLSRNGVLLRDFIPVRVGNVGYMYDRVTGQLFGNSGTGSFILGPDKH